MIQKYDETPELKIVQAAMTWYRHLLRNGSEDQMHVAKLAEACRELESLQFQKSCENVR